MNAGGVVGFVVTAAAVPAVPDPPGPTGVRVNPPYVVFPTRPPSVYDVPVIPVTVENPAPESVNDDAPDPPPHPNVIVVSVFELNANPVTDPGRVYTVPDADAALVRASVAGPLVLRKPAGPVAVTVNVYPFPAVSPVYACELVAGVYDVGVGDPVPVIEYDVIVPLGADHATVKPVVVAVPDTAGVPGAFGVVYTVPLVPDPVDAAVPAVPVPPAPLYAVTVIGPYPVFAARPE